MRHWVHIYNMMRVVIVTVLVTSLTIFATSYIVLSLPSFQNRVRTFGEKALGDFLHTQVTIGKVDLFPYHELVLHDVAIADQSGQPLLNLEKLGAGFSLYNLIIKKRLVFTYAELIGLNAHVTRDDSTSPTNLQFIIDALSSKDKTKPPTQFDLRINSVVIRKGALSYDVLSQAHIGGKFDKSHVRLFNLKADVSLPQIKNNDFIVDLKRMSFEEASGFQLVNLSTWAHVSDEELVLKHLSLELPHSLVTNDSIGVKINSLATLKDDIKRLPIGVTLSNVYITPADLCCFIPTLDKFTEPYMLTLKAEGNIDNVNISTLAINSESQDFSLSLIGDIRNITNLDAIEFNLPHINVAATAPTLSKMTSSLAHLSAESLRILKSCGNIKLRGNANGSKKRIAFNGDISTSLGNVDLRTVLSQKAANGHALKGTVKTDRLELGQLIGKQDMLGEVAMQADVELDFNKQLKAAKFRGAVPSLYFKGYKYTNISADVSLTPTTVDGVLKVNDDNCTVNVAGNAKMAGAASEVDVSMQLDNVNLAKLNIDKKNADKTLTVQADAKFVGDNLDNATGVITVNNLAYVDANDNGFHLKEFVVEASNNTTPQSINIRSDFFNGNIEGQYDIKSFVPSMRHIFAQALPSVIKDTDKKVTCNNSFTFDFVLEPNDELQKIVKLPVSVVYNATLKGYVNDIEGAFSVELSAPYLLQGNKIVENTKLVAFKNADDDNIRTSVTTLFPLKTGKAHVNVDANLVNDRLDTDLGWKMDKQRDYSGHLNCSALMSKDDDGALNFAIDVNPSVISFNDTVWNVQPSKIEISRGGIAVHDFRGSHEDQYLNIDGTVSKDENDELTLDMNKLSLDYVFETLEIENIMFMGVATGKFHARNLLSGSPVIETPNLHVDRIGYNKCIMGDADIEAKWDNETKAINLEADIKQDNGLHSRIFGSISPLKESLDISFEANKAQIGFLQPFMAAITSDISGEVSGNATLFGTFHDVNMYGDVFANSLRFKVDYTNVYYTASDSVHIKPGLIEFSNIVIRDRDGHTGKLSGYLRHKDFHNPVFDFTVKDAKELLCYDITEKMNARWYGSIYGNGAAYVKGEPGLVEIGVNMETVERSKFTFVLTDQEDALEYNFITFTDSHKAPEPENDDIPQIVKDLQKKNDTSGADNPSVFKINLQANITPEAQLIVVMDPVGGDRIKANGSGNMRLTYDSTDEALAMYGKYELQKGNYNFTLQDVVIKDFTIADGSSISFNGDPYDATLDIRAKYSLNASLLDLDESFALDRELNRTSVPVQAILLAKGSMNQPDISFDLDFPTISSDATRKVKSIISTEDMMNRQILYLLALNRFYTPEYMGNTGRGNELSSVASSTLSSQLSSMLGKLSDNWSISPNFRSDKGDFSDMEVDVALSSQLLNNRLLLNGNFGYRDNSMNTRNTNFIGDFDIEYLLNRKGTIRLKAYNHFNDQNYYVRSALTTQGVGVEFKFDFDNPFVKKKIKLFKQKHAKDSVSAPAKKVK